MNVSKSTNGRPAPRNSVIRSDVLRFHNHVGDEFHSDTKCPLRLEDSGGPRDSHLCVR